MSTDKAPAIKSLINSSPDNMIGHFSLVVFIRVLSKRERERERERNTASRDCFFLRFANHKGVGNIRGEREKAKEDE